VGVQIPKRATAVTGVFGVRRLAVALAFLGGLVVLTGCSEETRHEWENVAMPDPATKEGVQILEFWQWSWVAAMVTGVIVWALIFWVIWRYRRQSDDDVPVQTRYNLPLEIFYTIAPIIMVVVFFNQTVKVQNDLTAISDDPDHVVKVVGQQWSWTFNYADEPVAEGKNVFEVGAGNYTPTLVLPVDESVRFDLHSPDVIHSFWITGFLYKEDIVPGQVNQFEVTPNKLGTYRGKCAELCGTSHSRMLFNVKVVTRAEYDAYLLDQIALGFWSDEPILGNEESTTQAGLETDIPEGGTE
jgi:cytochrome c oxidase subunit II